MAMIPRGTPIWMFIYLVSVSCSSDGRRLWCSNDTMDPCYFLPNLTSIEVDWQTAWSACKEHGATLPTIETRHRQDILQMMLRSLLPWTSAWTAGREVRTTQWTWSNGRNLTGRRMIEKVDQLYETQAVVIRKTQVQFETVWPKNFRPYICQYSGNCSSADSIRVGTDCFVVSNEERKLVDARNRCVESGGDLATFEDEDALRSVEHSLVKDRGYWIGLRRSYWVWNKTDSSDEIRYSNWGQFENTLNQECMILRPYNSYRWYQSSCTERKGVLCQTVGDFQQSTTEKLHVDSTTLTSSTTQQQETPNKLTVESSSTTKRTTEQTVDRIVMTTASGMHEYQPRGSTSSPLMVPLVGAGIGILVVAVMIAVLVIFILKKRKRQNMVLENNNSKRSLDESRTMEEPVTASSPEEANETQGVYAQISKANTEEDDNYDDENKHRPGIVYATLQFGSDHSTKPEAGPTEYRRRVQSTLGRSIAAGIIQIDSYFLPDIVGVVPGSRFESDSPNSSPSETIYANANGQ